MAGSLGTLAIELAANTARLSSDMGKAVGIVERGARGMTNVLRGIATGAVVGSIVSVATRSIEIGDNLQKAAIKAGTTGKAMSELAYAARLSDIDIGALSGSLRKMQVALSEASTGAKGPNEALSALGLTIGELKSLSPDRQFELIADRISAIKDPADRARAATDLFGKSGADLLPLFEQGAGGIRKAREEAERLGLSFSDERIKALADADEAIKRLKASWEGFGVALATKVVGPLTTVLDLIAGNKTGKDVVGGLTGDMNKSQVVADLQRQIKSLNLNRNLNSPEMNRIVDGMIADLEERMRRISDGGGRGGPGRFGPVSPGYKPAEAAKASADSIKKTHADLSDFITKSSSDTLDAIMADGQTQVEADIQAYLDRRDMFDQMSKDMVTASAEATKEMSEFAKEASRNMQSAFADFLFDPFKDGLKGMLKGFLDTIRRMVAEAAAAKILGSKSSGGFGLGDAIGTAVSGLFGFATGGSFKVGGSGGTDSQLVAFKATPGEMVDVRTPGQGRGSVVYAPVTHINMHGSMDAKSAAFLRAEMERNNARNKADIINLIRGGAFA